MTFSSKHHVVESLRNWGSGVKCECDWLLSHYSRIVLQDNYHTVHTWVEQCHSHIC